MLLLKSESPSPKKCDHGDQGLERQIESDGSWRVKVPPLTSADTVKSRFVAFFCASRFL